MDKDKVRKQNTDTLVMASSLELGPIMFIAEVDHSLSGMLSLRPMVITNMMVRSSSCILT